MSFIFFPIFKICDIKEHQKEINNRFENPWSEQSRIFFVVVNAIKKKIKVLIPIISF